MADDACFEPCSAGFMCERCFIRRSLLFRRERNKPFVFGKQNRFVTVRVYLYGPFLLLHQNGSSAILYVYLLRNSHIYNGEHWQEKHEHHIICFKAQGEQCGIGRGRSAQCSR